MPDQPLPVGPGAAAAERPTLPDLVAAGTLDAQLAALTWLLSERGVPLVVAGPDRAPAENFRAALADLMPAGRRTGDGALPGGSVVARGLDEVIGLLGGPPAGEVPDDARDLGLVIVLGEGHVAAAHYVRPVERDGAGHLQRRPPALLADWNTAAGGFDHFWWGITHELADRCSMERDDFERTHAARTGLMGDLAAAGVRDPAELRRRIDHALLSAEREDSPDTPH